MAKIPENKQRVKHPYDPWVYKPGDYHAANTMYVLNGVKEVGNYMDTFDAKIWHTIFLHLDSYETIYELVLNHKHDPISSANFIRSQLSECCPTMYQGLVNYLESYGILPLQIHFTSREELAPLYNEPLNFKEALCYLFGIGTLGTPFHKSDGVNFVNGNPEWAHWLLMNHEYIEIPVELDRRWSIGRFKVLLQITHTAVIQVHSYELPADKKPGDIASLADWHMNKVRNIFLNDPKYIPQVQLAAGWRTDELPFRLNLEIIEDHSTILRNVQSPPDQLLNALFPCNGKDIKLKYLKKISEWQVNVDSGHRPILRTAVPPRGKNQSRRYPINYHSSTIDLILKQDTSMVQVKAVSNAVYQLWKYSQQFTSRMITSDEKEEEGPAKPFRILNSDVHFDLTSSKRDQLTFLRACFQNTSLDYYKVKQIQLSDEEGSDHETLHAGDQEAVYDEKMKSHDSSDHSRITESDLTRTKSRQPVVAFKKRVDCVRFRLSG